MTRRNNSQARGESGAAIPLVGISFVVGPVSPPEPLLPHYRHVSRYLVTLKIDDDPLQTPIRIGASRIDS